MSAADAQLSAQAITWNPVDKGSALSLSNNNLTATGGTGSGYTDDSVRATVGRSTGKFCFEVRVDVIGAANHTMIGICTSSALMSGGFHVSSAGYGYYMADGGKWNNGAGAAYGASYTAGDVITVMVDLSLGTVEFRKNNVSQGIAFTGLAAGTYFPALSLFQYSTAPVATARFRAADFTYASPSGYSAWDS